MNLTVTLASIQPEWHLPTARHVDDQQLLYYEDMSSNKVLVGTHLLFCCYGYILEVYVIRVFLWLSDFKDSSDNNAYLNKHSTGLDRHGTDQNSVDSFCKSICYILEHN